ncbi:MAG TPA: aminoacyl-tRNA hydrolase [Gammaproteobacteria bacterium]|nr:aminoacyl-tRNA hydrolase [Gammaproteobacteria bacterium]
MPALSSPIRLIVGLGNPGEEYANTRHNAGAWFAEKIAHLNQISFKREAKFKGSCTHFLFQDEKVHILIPDTFMNHSGQAVKLISDFYKITPEQILIAHDELDLPVGDTRLKFAGGHGGHNGLRDIIAHLHTHDFYRLRIGIAHPGDREKVLDYVLQRPSKEDKKIMTENIDQACGVLEYLLLGQNEKAMQLLHTKV